MAFHFGMTHVILHGVVTSRLRREVPHVYFTTEIFLE